MISGVKMMQNFWKGLMRMKRFLPKRQALTSVSLCAKSVSVAVGVGVDEYNELDDDFDEVLLVEDASIFSTSASSPFPSPGKVGLTLAFMVQLLVPTFCGKEEKESERGVKLESFLAK